jgi:ParB family transcriptional regulator, chromosome partitioning protein
MTSDTTAAPAVTLHAFVPAELDATGNYRRDLKITKEWVGQLKDHARTSPGYPVDGAADQVMPCGNHTPVPLARREDGTLRVLFGFRRVAGCEQAGVFVLGYVAGPDGDTAAEQRARLIDQFTENHGREDTTRSEDAGLIDALFDLPGTTAASVGKATGLGKAGVAAYRRVANSELAAKAADRWTFLTIEQSAALDEFEDDAEADAVTALVRVARDRPSDFPHELARQRAAKIQRTERAAFTAMLEEAGYEIRAHTYIPWTLDLDNLRTGDGAPIGPEGHAECPGRAVTIGYDYTWAEGAEAAYRAAHGLDPDDEIDFGQDEDAARAAGWAPRWLVTGHLCTDPGAHGHVNVRGEVGPVATTEQQTAEQEAQAKAKATEARRRLLARNREWKAANEVRTGRLRELAGLGSLPATAKQAATYPDRPTADAADLFTALATTRGETEPSTMGEGHKLAAELLGLSGDDRSSASARDLIEAELFRAAPARVKVIHLIMALAASEHGCRDPHVWQSAEGSGWRYYGVARPARYLAWLAEQAGYGLSDIESEVAARTVAPGPDDPEDPEDADDEPGTGREAGPDDELDPDEMAPWAGAEEALDEAHAAAAGPPMDDVPLPGGDDDGPLTVGPPPFTPARDLPDAEGEADIINATGA